MGIIVIISVLKVKDPKHSEGEQLSPESSCRAARATGSSGTMTGSEEFPAGPAACAAAESASRSSSQ